LHCGRQKGAGAQRGGRDPGWAKTPFRLIQPSLSLRSGRGPAYAPIAAEVNQPPPNKSNKDTNQSNDGEEAKDSGPEEVEVVKRGKAKTGKEAKISRHDQAPGQILTKFSKLRRRNFAKQISQANFAKLSTASVF
jgi:hypothetical protein